MRGQGQGDGTARPGEVTAGPGRAEVPVSAGPGDARDRGTPRSPPRHGEVSLSAGRVCVLFPFAFVPGDGQGGRELANVLQTESLHRQKASPAPTERAAWREHGGVSCSLPGEPRWGQPPAAGLRSAWAMARSCTTHLQSRPVTDRARGGRGLRGFAHHAVPSWETSGKGDSAPSRGSLSRRFLLFIPGKFLPAHGRSCSSASSSWEGARLLWQRQRRQCPLASVIRVGLVSSLPASCLAHRLCQGTAGRGRQFACLFGVAFIWSRW